MSHGAQPTTDSPPEGSDVVLFKLKAQDDEISDHGHRLSAVEKGIMEIRLDVTTLVTEGRAARRFITVVLSILGIVATVAGILVSVLKK